MMRWVLAAGVLMVLLAACGGNDDRPDGAVTPGVTGGQPGPGVLIVANLDALVEYDIESGNQSTLLQSPATNSFLLDPAVNAREVLAHGYPVADKRVSALLPKEMLEDPVMYPAAELLSRLEAGQPSPRN